jgi:membrane associated rhomboid family serine protease
MGYRRYYMSGPRLGGMMTPGVKALLIANAVGFLLQMAVGRRVEDEILIPLLGLTPAAVWEQLALWQPVTYMFLHGGGLHLLFNMLALWMFGGTLESVWGTKQFLKYYFITGVGAGLSNCLLTPTMTIPIIGASGAVYGLLAAYGILFPNSLIYVYGLFPVKAKWLVIIFGVFEFLASVNPATGNIAHLVHLGGMLIGVVYLRRDYFLRWSARRVKGWQHDKQQRESEKQASREDSLRREVDDLLDKINEVGIDNLTSWERRRLREASEKLRQMEEDGRRL